MDIQNNNAICPVPFYSVSYNTTGVMGPCTHCDLTEFKSINDYWGSEELKKLRTDMLSGIRNPACSLCHSREDAGAVTLRTHALEKNKDFDYKIDNNVITQLLSRFSNICNFMCLDCNSTASSLIFKEEVDKGIKTKEYPIIYSGQDPDLLLEQMKEHIHTVENLSFSGGEPTIHPQHWDLLNYMVDNNLKPNLNYFTNFSKLVYKGQDIVDLWNHFPNIRVHVGFDAMEEAGDYFRYKMNWNQTIENVKRVNLEAPHVKLVVTVTFTWMTALNAVKMIHWFSENFPKLEIAFNLVIHQHLNMQLAPEYKKKQIEKALESLLTIDQTNYLFDRKMVTGYISYLWEKDKSNEFAQALKWVKEMDDWRGHDFRNVFPEHQDIKYEDYF